MKLTTRLALVVTVLLAVVSIISSTQALLVDQNQKLVTYKKVLNNLANQLNTTKEKETSLALLLANNSPIPMTLAFVANKTDVTFLTESAGSELKLPSATEYRAGLKAPLDTKDYLIRFHQLSPTEYLAFYLSTATLNQELRNAFKPIIGYNFLIIVVAALLVIIIFRRDSKLNSAARGMQEFIGDASHELKTPLTVIRGYSELLQSNPEDSAKYAKRINDESLRMSGIIDKLLKISALDEGRTENAIEVELSDHLKSYIEDLLILQPKRNITFISQPLIIKAPLELVDNLFTNLISNARIHTPIDAPIRISMMGRTVVVEDGGPGLTEIPTKPFHRFDSSRSRETGGSGLGMSLIQKSAKALGAKLTFGKSELGGLKVQIEL